MACKHEDIDGKCTLWDGDDPFFEHIAESCDADGYCCVSEDQFPEDSCEDYEESE